MKSLKERSLALHKKHKGKLEIIPKVPLETNEDLSLAYSPGVAEPCRIIANNKQEAYTYTTKQNMVAVVTDGSAVLGLGNIGAEASLPVMEGKAVLFKAFANVDAVPVCLNTQDADKIVETCKHIAPTYGGINLEDIAAPKCIEVEQRLKEALDIPVFHDDQHGTAIVTAAGMLNSCRLLKRSIKDLDIVLCGTGAAGHAIAKMLNALGVKRIHAYNKQGVLSEENIAQYDNTIQSLFRDGILASPSEPRKKSLSDLMKGADAFIGVSVGNLLDEGDIRNMNDSPIVFALANPDPEIDPKLAIKAGAAIVGTGRSDHPNQINNVLAFPGIFRGALDARAREITDEMKLAAAHAIAGVIDEKDLRNDYIIPSPYNKRVALAVAEAVRRTAKK